MENLTEFECSIKHKKVTKSECIVCFNTNEHEEKYRPYCRQLQLELSQLRGKRDR